jgi:hypothetical protein
MRMQGFLNTTRCGSLREPRLFPGWVACIAYVRSERASASVDAKKSARVPLDYNIMDHFPTNWGRPVSPLCQPYLSQILSILHRNMTALIQAQLIPSITVAMHNRHLTVLCSIHSMFFSAASDVAHSKSMFRQPIVTGTSVLAIKYKDGIMMAADNLGSDPFYVMF